LFGAVWGFQGLDDCRNRLRWEPDSGRESFLAAFFRGGRWALVRRGYDDESQGARRDRRRASRHVSCHCGRHRLRTANQRREVRPRTRPNADRAPAHAGGGERAARTIGGCSSESGDAPRTLPEATAGADAIVVGRISSAVLDPDYSYRDPWVLTRYDVQLLEVI